MSIAYKRVLLKLSGEALSGKDGIINYDYIKEIGSVIRRCLDEGAQIAIVVGAGNIWRGRQGFDMDRVRADQMLSIPLQYRMRLFPSALTPSL